MVEADEKAPATSPIIISGLKIYTKQPLACKGLKLQSVFFSLESLVLSL